MVSATFCGLRVSWKMRRRREACDCGPPPGGGLAFALALMFIAKVFWVCRVRNKFLRRSVLDFLFLGLGVWGDGLFSLAVFFGFLDFFFFLERLPCVSGFEISK